MNPSTGPSTVPTEQLKPEQLKTKSLKPELLP